MDSKPCLALHLRHQFVFRNCKTHSGCFHDVSSAVAHKLDHFRSAQEGGDVPPLLDRAQDVASVPRVLIGGDHGESGFATAKPSSLLLLRLSIWMIEEEIVCDRLLSPAFLGNEYRFPALVLCLHGDY